VVGTRTPEGPALAVRPARPADAAAIADVHIEAWRRAYRHVLGDRAPAGAALAGREGRWREMLEQEAPRRHVLVVGRPGAPPDGFAAWGPTRDDDEDPAVTAELAAIYVRPALWGAGAGRLLMERGRALARGDGFVRATLWVVEDNPRARRFYAAAGWAPDGRRRVEAVLGREVREVRYRTPLTLDAGA
jgi:GNAT superfamily N-acetyltransferase